MSGRYKGKFFDRWWRPTKKSSAAGGRLQGVDLNWRPPFGKGLERPNPALKRRSSSTKIGQTEFQRAHYQLWDAIGARLNKIPNLPQELDKKLSLVYLADALCEAKRPMEMETAVSVMNQAKQELEIIEKDPYRDKLMCKQQIVYCNQKLRDLAAQKKRGVEVTVLEVPTFGWLKGQFWERVRRHNPGAQPEGAVEMQIALIQGEMENIAKRLADGGNSSQDVSI